MSHKRPHASGHFFNLPIANVEASKIDMGGAKNQLQGKRHDGLLTRLPGQLPFGSCARKK